MEMRPAKGSGPHAAARPLLLAGTLVVLAACSNEPPAAPYLQNPDAQDAYAVTLTLHDAPPDLVASSAYVQYRIADTACMPPVRNFAGVRREPVRHTLDIPLKRIDAATYAGTYFGDGVLEKDYFGRGICRWKITQVGAFMEAEGTKSFTCFSTSADPVPGTSTRFARKDVSPPLTDGAKYSQSDWSEEMFLREVQPDQRHTCFSYSLTIERTRMAP